MAEKSLLAPTFPRIVCLCGSTRFTNAFADAHFSETLAGRISLLPSGRRVTDAGAASALNELHLRKIDLAGEVFVLNVGGYIGESTRGEIEYAEASGKPVRYLEPLAARTPVQEVDREA